MNSLRLVSRALPKASLRRSVVRYSSSVSRLALRRPVWQTAAKASYPAFSTSAFRREAAGDFDVELSEKLNSEQQLELENSGEGALSEINDFLKNHDYWKVQDKPGTHEVFFTREFGNEKIKVALTVADIDNIADEDEYGGMDEDAALDDEVDYGSNKATINQSGVRGGKVDVMPEDSIAPADRDAEDTGLPDETPAYPINLTITITKPSKRAIEIRAVAQEGTIELDSISIFPKESLLEAQTPKDAQEARSLYAGPTVGNLDPDLQAMLEKYLEERGIDVDFANFLPKYIDYKEQREYVQWLDDMKTFVEE
ncbi:hypothetical protein PV08_10763 [Exophiala spinifera]|uniref:Mitochondrial glycoprotein n=1 Tax=Exophiala spinifera TaxID=91928 RepID=A0A0D2AXP5_9EURO|nr:uncharacterized protein PV08_10763 [Exophiala spinifera]KIW11463.1 hypothetical protein PV08_10763 [Exophiala spinifera]